MYQEGTTGVPNPGRAIGDAVDLARLSTKWEGFDDTLEEQIHASERILQGARNYALNPSAHISYVPLETAFEHLAGDHTKRLTPRERKAGTEGEQTLNARATREARVNDGQSVAPPESAREDSLSSALGPAPKDVSASAHRDAHRAQSAISGHLDRRAAFPVSAAQSLSEVRPGGNQAPARPAQFAATPSNGATLDR